MSDKSYSIGIDVGGMSIKIGVVNREGKIIKQSRVKTAKMPEQVVADMSALINQLLIDCNLTESDLSGIGVGCPGAVNRQTGMVDFLPNLGWENVPLVKMMQQKFNLPVVLSNDANVAALAEALYGAAKGSENVVMFTLGTGVGGGVIIDKKLFEGGWSRGTELGHATLFADGENCTCGRRGCVECYTSATALIKQTKQAMLTDKNSQMWEFVGGDIEKVDGRTAFECSKTGDATAIKVVDKYVYYLGESILNMLNIFRPEVFILGGGVSAQGEYLNKKLTDYCEKFDYGYKMAPKTKIVTAILGNDAGIIGAAALV